MAADSSIDSLLRAVARFPEPSSALATLCEGIVVARKFRLVRLLGEGGMGVVWEAVHEVTGRAAALKFVKRSSDDRVRVRRFLREARAASAVRHPSVVDVYDLLELEDGSPVMVMELLHGETLGQRLAGERALSLSELARIAVHVCSAVGKAHELGIVHRDLKPENIFLVSVHDPAAAPPVKVLDFGIAKLTAAGGDAAMSSARTTTGALMGTPYYMSPEQILGEKDVDHRSDIWALGVILYEALSGVRPIQGKNLAQIVKRVTSQEIVPIQERAASVPDPVAALLGRMLQRDRTKRPGDLREVCDALLAYSTESVPSFGAPTPAT